MGLYGGNYTNNYQLSPVIIPPTPIQRGTGGGVIVPQKVLITARGLIEVQKISEIRKTINLFVQNISFVNKIPVEIRHLILDLRANLTSLVLETFIEGLTLKIGSSEIILNESES